MIREMYNNELIVNCQSHISLVAYLPILRYTKRKPELDSPGPPLLQGKNIYSPESTSAISRILSFGRVITL